MPNKIFNIRLRNKRDTEANWEKKDPLILDGETIVVTTASGETRVKIGDGAKNYTQLPFLDEVLKNEINNKAAIDAGVYTAVASSSDGVAYIATVPGIESLSSGASFIMIPDKTSASKEPTIDVNGLGAKKIRRRLSAITTSLQSGYSNTWISINKPFQIVYDGATWVGWYSDAACTNLVSTDQNYSISPASDLTLYAKATHDAELFTCAAVAGANISSASVSDPTVPTNGNCTFSATVNTGYVFDGWYLDESCTNLVSAENPYTATITTNTTLYAKAHLSKLNISVGQAEHGTASVNASVITYGDNATFTFNPESDDYKLYGWYADEGLTQLVSEDNPYTCTPTTDYKLYPKSGAVMYTIKLTRGLKGVAGRSGTWTLKIAALYYDQLTYNEKQYVKTGEFDKIESSKVFGQTTKTGTDTIAAVKASLQVPANTTCAIWCQLSDALVTCFAESGDISLGERSMLTYWPYYIFTPTQDKEYFCYYSDSACICTAIAKDGIEYADATTPIFAGKDAMFTAIVKEGYTFKGWYSDEGCTTFISSNNPLSITTPSVNKDSADPQDGEATTSKLTLYARVKSITVGSNILYFKANGLYKSATKVYKKVSGTWVQQEDLSAIFSGESSGTASNYVYGGSV